MRRSTVAALLLGIVAGCKSPTRVQGPPAPAAVEIPRVPLASGRHFSCALRPGGVVCWGSGLKGWLPPRTRARAKVGIKGVSLGAGDHHACAITAAGKVRCWGSNSRDQLGEPTDGAIHPGAASVVPLPRRALSVAGGRHHTCALLESGKVWCWGANYHGETGGPRQKVSPHAVALARPAIAISAGGHLSCALVKGGAVRCWGRLGREETRAPRAIAGLAGIEAISSSSRHTCAVDGSGALRCFSHRRPEPRAVSLGQPAVDVRVGRHGACALARSRRVLCFELGKDGSASGVRPVPKLGGASAITVGRDQACAQTRPLVSCWKLGAERDEPTRVKLPAWVSARPPRRLPAMPDKYERLAKAGEAIRSLDRMTKALERLAPKAALQQLKATGWTPRAGCCKGQGARCRSDRSTFAHPTWRAIDFHVSGAHNYQYRLTAQPGENRLLLEARADLDCDGAFSRFFVYPVIDTDGSWRMVGPLIENPLE